MKFVMAQRTDGTRTRVGVRHMGLRYYRKPFGHQAWAFGFKIEGKLHYLRVDAAIVDRYGWAFARSEIKRFLKAKGIKPASIMKAPALQ